MILRNHIICFLSLEDVPSILRKALFWRVQIPSKICPTWQPSSSLGGKLPQLRPNAVPGAPASWGILGSGRVDHISGGCGQRFLTPDRRETKTTFFLWKVGKPFCFFQDEVLAGYFGKMDVCKNFQRSNVLEDVRGTKHA